MTSWLRRVTARRIDPCRRKVGSESSFLNGLLGKGLVEISRSGSSSFDTVWSLGETQPRARVSRSQAWKPEIPNHLSFVRPRFVVGGLQIMPRSTLPKTAAWTDSGRPFLSFWRGGPSMERGLEHRRQAALCHQGLVSGAAESSQRLK